MSHNDLFSTHSTSSKCLGDSPIRIVGERVRRLRDQQRSKSASKIARNKFGETKLHTACKKGDVESVKQLLASPENFLINAQDNNLWTPLHEACNAGHVEIVRVLMAYQPNAAQSQNAILLGRTTIEKNPSIDLNAKSLEGITPLHDAVLCDQVEVVKALLESSAGLKVLWDHEAPEVRGEALHAELPFVSKFAEASMVTMREVLEAAMRRCRELFLTGDGNNTTASSITSSQQPPLPQRRISSSSSQRAEDTSSQFSEGSQSQNFCPSDSQYDDAFAFPAPAAVVDAPSGGKKTATEGINVGGIEAAKRVLFHGDNNNAASNREVEKRKTRGSQATPSLDAKTTSATASNPKSASNRRNSTSPNEHRVKQSDVDSLVGYQLLLLSSYIDFMEQTDNKEDGGKRRKEAEGKMTSEGGGGGGGGGEESEVKYGDARVLRRLPKHVRNLRRHIERLLANDRRQDKDYRHGNGRQRKEETRCAAREELTRLERMFGHPSDG